MSTEHDRLTGGQGEIVWGHPLSVSTHTHSRYFTQTGVKNLMQAGGRWWAQPTQGGPLAWKGTLQNHYGENSPLCNENNTITKNLFL